MKISLSSMFLISLFIVWAIDFGQRRWPHEERGGAELYLKIYKLQDTATIIYRDKGCLGCLQLLRQILTEKPDLHLIVHTSKPVKVFKLLFDHITERIHIDRSDHNFPIDAEGGIVIYVHQRGDILEIPFLAFVEKLHCSQPTGVVWQEELLSHLPVGYDLYGIFEAQQIGHTLYISAHVQRGDGFGLGVIFQLVNGQWKVIYDLYSVDPKMLYPFGRGHFYLSAGELHIISTLDFIKWNINKGVLESRIALPLPEDHSTDIYSSSYYFDDHIIVVPIEHAFYSSGDTMLYHQTAYGYRLRG